MIREIKVGETYRLYWLIGLLNHAILADKRDRNDVSSN
jgi:hypothetical protein